MKEKLYEGQMHEIKLRFVEENICGEVLSAYFIHISPKLKGLADMFSDKKHYTKLYKTEKRALQVYDYLCAYAADQPYQVENYAKKLRFTK